MIVKKNTYKYSVGDIVWYYPNIEEYIDDGMMHKIIKRWAVPVFIKSGLMINCNLYKLEHIAGGVSENSLKLITPVEVL